MIPTIQQELDRQAHAVRRKRRVFEEAAFEAEVARNATPETLRNRRAIVVDELLARGKLTQAEHRAACEIELIFTTITRALCPRIQDLNRTAHGAPSLDWSPTFVARHSSRYVPWRAASKPVRHKSQTTDADLVVKVAVDNLGILQIADSYKIDRRRVLALVRNSLNNYAKFAGWI